MWNLLIFYIKKQKINYILINYRQNNLSKLVNYSFLIIYKLIILQKEFNMSRTFSIIKPDATKRNITGAINNIIENNDLKIIAQKRVKLSKLLAEGFYSIHKEKPFFNDLINYMISEPVVVQVLEGDNAVEKYRNVMGSTNPENAANGTIRKMHALNVQENSVHGSDSMENAEIEINFFFNNNEIVG